jgi:hypothetical protein
VAAGALLLELGYPLALFNRIARWIVVPSMMLMHVGIYLLMGPLFREFLICNVFWVPWSALLARAFRGRRG